MASWFCSPLTSFVPPVNDKPAPQKNNMTTTADVNSVAEPSAATSEVQPIPVPANFDPQDQYTWSPEQREQWNKDGKIPSTPAKKEEAAASAKSKEKSGADPASAEADPAPEAGKNQEPPKKGGKLSAKERNVQLDDEIADLQAKLEKRASLRRQLEQDGKPAETSTAKPAAKPEVDPDAPKRPARPKEADFNGDNAWERYTQALEKYEDDLIEFARANAEYTTRKTIEAERQKQALADAERAFRAKFDEAKKLYPDLEDRSKRVLERLSKEDVLPFVRAFVDESAIFPHLIGALDSDQLNQIVEMAKSQPGKALRVIRDLELEVERELAKGAEPGKKPKAAESPETPKPRAPKPPSEVGGRGAAPEDALVSAAKSGSFTSFEAEQNRRMFRAQK